MFDVNNVEKKSAILKFMNLESVTFDELKIILDEQVSEINNTEDGYEFWCRVANAELGGEFDKFKFIRGERYANNKVTVDGEDFDSKTLNEWLGKTFTEIEFEGGEGEGEYAHVVVKHLESGRYLKLVGYYYSYDGFDWSGCEWFEVNPVEVTVTKYL